MIDGKNGICQHIHSRPTELRIPELSQPAAAAHKHTINEPPRRTLAPGGHVGNAIAVATRLALANAKPLLRNFDVKIA